MTEIVFALGLGDRLVGVSGPFDDYPAEAKDIEEVGGAGDFGVDPHDREGRLAGARSVPDDPRRRPVEATPAGPRHPRRHPARGHARRSPRRHRDGRRAHGRPWTKRMRSRRRWARTRTRSRRARRRRGHVTCFFEVYYPPLTTVGPNTFIYDLLERAGCDPVTEEAKSRLPGVVGGRARGRRSGGVPRDAGVREERRGGREAARVRRDPGDRGRPGGCWSTATW